MTIDRLGAINSPLYNTKVGTNKINRNAGTDSISLSPEAVKKSELYQAHEVVDAALDVRAERIAELRRKINDPSYITDTILNAVADNLMTALGF